MKASKAKSRSPRKAKSYRGKPKPVPKLRQTRLVFAAAGTPETEPPAHAQPPAVEPPACIGTPVNAHVHLNETDPIPVTQDKDSSSMKEALIRGPASAAPGTPGPGLIRQPSVMPRQNLAPEIPASHVPKPLHERRLDPESPVLFCPNWIPSSAAFAMLEALQSTLPWAQQSLTLFNKPALERRLTCFFADAGLGFAYSGIERRGHGNWPPILAHLRAGLTRALGTEFNAVLVNLYRDGKDHLSYHRDNERAFGREPIIASISLGAVRTFSLRRYASKDGLVEYHLNNGSLLVMQGKCQELWEHAVKPVTRAPTGPRINLTFRFIHPSLALKRNVGIAGS